MFVRLALQSLINRRGAVLLSVMAMTISIFVLLSVEHIRQQSKQSFTNSVSGVDLIAGARTGRLNLLLYSVFRIGTPTNNMRWSSYQAIAEHPKVAWTIPISLGDSHRGYRVVGTNQNFFRYFSYGKKKTLTFSAGAPFERLFDVVIGAQVARSLDLQLGDDIVIAHGIAANSFSNHDDHPFTVTGILNTTGTPVDQALYVSLEGIEAIHLDWQQGVKTSQQIRSKKELETLDIKPQSITALMIGLNTKIATFRVQRDINDYSKEPLMAVLPGVALTELWRMMGILENTLLLVSTLVFIAACLGVSAVLLSSLREREREIQLLRIIGAPPFFLFLLIELEAVLITLLSIILGIGLLSLGLFFLQDYLLSTYNLYISGHIFSIHSMKILFALLFASLATAIIPSVGAYYRGSKASQ